MKSSVESLPLLQGVIDCIDVGTLVLDASERVVLWNRWMDHHSGVLGAETLERSFFDLFPEQRGKRLEAAIGQALRNNLPSLLSQTLNRWPLPLYANKSAAEKGERMQQQITVTPLNLGNNER